MLINRFVLLSALFFICSTAFARTEDIPETFFHQCQTQLFTPEQKRTYLTQMYKVFLAESELESGIEIFANSEPVSLNNTEYYKSISKYSDMGYKINGDLVKIAPRNDSSLRERDKLIEELQDTTSMKVTSYSGANLDLKDLDFYRSAEGKQVRLKFFLSSSTSEFQAESKFIQVSLDSKYVNKTPVIFIISSLTGKDISFKSEYPEEAEVLFKPDTIFLVKNIKKREFENIATADKKIYQQGFEIHLEEIAESAMPQVLPITINSDYVYQSQRDNLRLGGYASTEGTTPFVRWLLAHQTYVENSKDHSVTMETLKEIHKVVMSVEKFYGAKIRRIREKYRKKLLTLSQSLEEFYKLEKTIESESTAERFAGKFRARAVDHFIFSGDHFDKDHKRYMTEEEFEGVLANPYFRIQQDSYKKHKDGYKADLHFVPPEFIEPYVESAIQHFLKRSERNFLRAVAVLEKELISIHPFLDGNGRTIRLFIDMILAKHHYPLPLNPLENEYSSSVDDLERQLRTQMMMWRDYEKRVY
ncbi:MAG: Fic family protein [Xanthomonadaceae bacterium]|nr:Fic family protein [Xanthomonadaceae bacterium]